MTDVFFVLTALLLLQKVPAGKTPFHHLLICLCSGLNSRQFVDRVLQSSPEPEVIEHRVQVIGHGTVTGRVVLVMLMMVLLADEQPSCLHYENHFGDFGHSGVRPFMDLIRKADKEEELVHEDAPRQQIVQKSKGQGQIH